MPAIPADSRTAHWATEGKSGRFLPRSSKAWSDPDWRDRAQAWRDGHTWLCARLVLSLLDSRTGQEVHRPEEVMQAAVKALKESNGSELPAFIQRGNYRPSDPTMRPGAGVQVFVFARKDTPMNAWEKQVIRIGEILAAQFGQAEVVAEVQASGLRQNIVGVVA